MRTVLATASCLAKSAKLSTIVEEVRVDIAGNENGKQTS
jgi:hypothetical protein